MRSILQGLAQQLERGEIGITVRYRIASLNTRNCITQDSVETLAEGPPGTTCNVCHHEDDDRDDD